MDTPGYVILSRLGAQQRATQVLANNLANADTPGFQAQRPIFARFLHALAARRAAARHRLQRRPRHLAGHAAGPLTTTGNPLDVALRGDGFFAVDTPARSASPAPAASPWARTAAWWMRRAMRCWTRAARPSRFAPATAASRSRATAPSARRMAPSAACAWFASTAAEAARRRRPAVRHRGAAAAVDRGRQLVQGAVEGSNVSTVMEIVRMTEEVRALPDRGNFAEREGERLQAAVDRILRQPAAADEPKESHHALPAHRRHRDAGAADQCRSHLEQHRQYEHHRLQAPAGRIPGPDLPEHPPGRLAVLGERHRAAGRRAGRARRQDRGIYRIGEQGSLQQTENRFDLAIRGNGFFQVQLPSGDIAYTRDGTFGLSAEGQIVTAEGFPVLPGHHHPRRGGRRHHQRHRRSAGQDGWPGRAAECRAAADRGLRQ